MTFADSGTVVTIDRASAGSAERLAVRTGSVSAGYLESLRIPLLAGRDFATADEAGTATAIVNETPRSSAPRSS